MQGREKENCVACGKEVDIPKDLHIDFRGDSYIEGAGQICPDCDKRLREKGV